MFRSDALAAFSTKKTSVSDRNVGKIANAKVGIYVDSHPFLMMKAGPTWYGVVGLG